MEFVGEIGAVTTKCKNGITFKKQTKKGIPETFCSHCFHELDKNRSVLFVGRSSTSDETYNYRHNWRTLLIDRWRKGMGWELEEFISNDFISMRIDEDTALHSFNILHYNLAYKCSIIFCTANWAMETCVYYHKERKHFWDFTFNFYIIKSKWAFIAVW